MASCHLNFHAVQYSGGFFWSTLGLSPCNANEAFTPDPWQSWMVFASLALSLSKHHTRKNWSLFITCLLDVNELKYSLRLPLCRDLFKIQLIIIELYLSILIIINNVDRQHLFYSNFHWTSGVVNISANLQIVPALLALSLSQVE